MILAHVAGWKPHHLHDLAQVCWVGSVLHRSGRTSHNGRLGPRWPRSWSVRLWKVSTVKGCWHGDYFCVARFQGVLTRDSICVSSGLKGPTVRPIISIPRTQLTVPERLHMRHTPGTHRRMMFFSSWHWIGMSPPSIAVQSTRRCLHNFLLWVRLKLLCVWGKVCPTQNML